MKVLQFALVMFGICAFVSTASADGFDTFGDHKQLENKAVIASGKISKRTSFASYSNELSYSESQKQPVFEIGRFCFKNLELFEDLSGKAGLLLADQFTNASIALITASISSIKIKIATVEVLDCEALAMQESSSTKKHFQQQAETLKQQQAILEKMKKAQRAGAKKSP